MHDESLTDLSALVAAAAQGSETHAAALILALDGLDAATTDAPGAVADHLLALRWSVEDEVMTLACGSPAVAAVQATVAARSLRTAFGHDGADGPLECLARALRMLAPTLIPSKASTPATAISTASRTPSYAALS